MLLLGVDRKMVFTVVETGMRKAEGFGVVDQIRAVDSEVGGEIVMDMVQFPVAVGTRFSLRVSSNAQDTREGVADYLMRGSVFRVNGDTMWVSCGGLLVMWTNTPLRGVAVGDHVVFRVWRGDATKE